MLTKLVRTMRRDCRMVDARVVLGLFLLVILAHFLPGLGGVSFAAVTVTLTGGLGAAAKVSQDYQEWSITMTANTDTTTGSITHLMGAFAKNLIITALSAVGSVSAFFQASLTSTVWSATNGSTQAGSGSAQATVRLERAK